MPGKSRHGKGKRFHQSKRSKIVQRSAVVNSQTQAASNMPKPAVPVGVTAAPKTAVTPAAAVSSQSAYVVGELKRIGILTGIIIIILVVLSIVLS